MQEFAVLDLETTGLFPEKYDRIIEIAIITLNPRGEIIDSYETLVNPERDLGPTHIHKISAGMVYDAPRFIDIAGDVVQHLAGKHLVGHNISYDYRFLKQEFKRLDIDIPESQLSCTLNISRQVEPDLPCRKLEFLCQYFNITHENKHSAFSDCYATVMLFQTLLRKHQLEFLKDTSDWEQFWPELPVNNIQYKRKQYEKKEKGSYISHLIERLPNSSFGEVESLDYLNLLDHILADRRINPQESEALFKFAAIHNLSKQAVISLHNTYLKNLVKIALLDGVITEAEMNDIREVAAILNICSGDLDKTIDLCKSNLSKSEFTDKLIGREYQGKSVCFTGTLSSMAYGRLLTREEAQSIALEHGLIIKSGVTKDLDFLVAADPDSMSGKAKKARQYNIKIMAEQAFWNMLGVQF